MNLRIIMCYMAAAFALNSHEKESWDYRQEIVLDPEKVASISARALTESEVSNLRNELSEQNNRRQYSLASLASNGRLEKCDVRALPMLPYIDLNGYIQTSNVLYIFRIEFHFEANEERDAAVVYDARTISQLQCNGMLGGLYRSDRWLTKYKNIEIVRIRKGENSVVMYVLGQKGRASASCTIQHKSRAVDIARENDLVFFLRTYIFKDDPKECLRYNSVLGKSEDVFVTPVREFSDKPALRDAAWDLGLRTLRVRFDSGETIEETVLCETAADVGKFLLGVKDKAARNLNLIAAVEAAGNRVVILRDKVRKRGLIPDYELERNYIEALDELLRTMRDVEEPQYSIETRAGWFWGAAENVRYRMYIPKPMADKSVEGIIVVYPSSAPGKDVFEDSYIVNNRDLVQHYRLCSENGGYVIIWPWGENKEHDANTEWLVRRSVEDAIVRLRRYQIKRIIVVGACGAGRDALVFSARHSKMVDGVVSHATPIGRLAPSVRSGNLADVNPLELANELVGKDVVLTHGALDRHIRFQNSEILAFALRKAGGNPILVLLEDSDEAYFPRCNFQWLCDGLEAIERKWTTQANHLRNQSKAR